jgi:hypothetical protein
MNIYAKIIAIYMKYQGNVTRYVINLKIIRIIMYAPWDYQSIFVNLIAHFIINQEKVAKKDALFKQGMKEKAFAIIQKKSINAAIYVAYMKNLMDVKYIVIFL